MKIVIPSAGTGRRLFPHTHTKPKSMVFIAGKPIIGHILDRLNGLDYEEIILVVGYMKEQLMSYIDQNYASRFNITYVNQDELLGLGHSIYMAKDSVGDSPIMIALGDMIFQSGYREFYERHIHNGECSGSIGVWEVDEPEKYGIVELDGGYITSLEEKPAHPRSNLGMAGVYFINNTPLLFDKIKHLMENNLRNRGEYQLTDALQLMVQEHELLKTFMVSSWYDCGRPETLLATNRVLLKARTEVDHDYITEDSLVIQPVAIGRDVVIRNSVVGPNASIAASTVIESSVISDSVIGSGSKLVNVNIKRSIVGDSASITGKYNSLNVGDSSVIEF